MHRFILRENFIDQLKNLGDGTWSSKCGIGVYRESSLHLTTLYHFVSKHSPYLLFCSREGASLLFQLSTAINHTEYDLLISLPEFFCVFFSLCYYPGPLSVVQGGALVGPELPAFLLLTHFLLVSESLTLPEMGPIPQECGLSRAGVHSSTQL